MPLAKDADLTGYTVEYNGVVFSGGQEGRGMMPPEIKLDGQAVYDAAGRQLIYTTYTLSVQTIIFSDTKEDMGGDCRSLRNKLMQAGKTLKLKGTGFTDVTEVSDIANGPKPQSCSFKPLGGNISWLINWVVTFSIKECYSLSSSLDSIRIESLSYTVSHTLDPSGFATRVITGQATVPIKYPNAAQLTADKLRENLFFELPTNFRRISQQFDISADRKTIAFAIVDRQDTGKPLPFGCVHADGNFRLNALGFQQPAGAEGGGFATGSASMQLSFVVAPEYNRNIAGVWFWMTMLAMQGQLIFRLSQDEHEDVGKNQWGTVLPSSISMQYGMFDRYRESAFAVEWMLVGPMLVLLQSNEVWQAVPNTNYQQWKTSVARIIRSEGMNNVRPDFLRDDVEAIIDVCDLHTFAHLGYSTEEEWHEGNYGSYYALCPQIDEQRSWLVYKPTVTVHHDQHTQVHRKASQYEPGPWETSTSTDPLDGTQPGPIENYQSGQNEEDESHQLEYRGRPSTRVAVQFVGVRLNWQPTYPVLKSIDGTPAYLSKTVGLNQKVIGNIAGCKLWAVRSTHIYEVEGKVNRVKPHEQPAMGWADRRTTGETEDL